MKTLPLVLILTIAAFLSAKAQVPDGAVQPIKVGGKITLIDTSGHHIGLTTEGNQRLMFTYTTGISVLDEAGTELALTALRVGMPATVTYNDLPQIGRLVASKIVVIPVPLTTPASTPAAAPAPKAP